MDSPATEIILTLLVFGSYFIADRTVTSVLDAIGRRKQAAPKRAFYIAKTFNMGLLVVSILLLSLVWGIDYRSVFLVASSVLAVIGVAFFAQWSILSNITASIVIFFSYPARIGDYVRILDNEHNTIQGTIRDINMFQVILEDDEGNTVNYPNNLIMQRPLIRLEEGRRSKPRGRFDRPTDRPVKAS